MTISRSHTETVYQQGDNDFSGSGFFVSRKTIWININLRMNFWEHQICRYRRKRTLKFEWVTVTSWTFWENYSTVIRSCNISTIFSKHREKDLSEFNPDLNLPYILSPGHLVAKKHNISSLLNSCWGWEVLTGYTV